MSNRNVNTEAEKLRGLPPEELQRMEREQMDQLFRLRFQLRMGQTESVQKIRSLRRGVARLKTIQRQHQLGIVEPAAKTAAGPESKTAVKASGKASQPAAKTAGKKSAGKKKTVKAGKK